MVEHVALYILSGSTMDGQAVLQEIRASDFIDEVNSGEGPREECGLYKLVQVVPDTQYQHLDSEKELLEFHTKLCSGEIKSKVAGQDVTWNPNVLLIANKDSIEKVTILELQKGKVVDKLIAKPRSSLEVASNLSVANMSIQEYKNMCGNAEVYDAGQ